METVFIPNIRWVVEEDSQPGMMVKDPNVSKRREAMKEEHRQRKTHKKVRTGCLTCKIRRKKCDEAKPVCHRCSNAGIKCDGYTTKDLPLREGIKRHQATSLPSESSCPSLSFTVSGLIENDCYPPMSRISALNNGTAFFTLTRPLNYFADLHQVSDLERHCFAYFRHRTAPQLASYIETSLWRSGPLRGLNHPALFSAAVALGAVHRRFSYGISREAFEYCAHVSRLHTTAMQHLKELKLQMSNAPGFYDRETIMMTEIVLGMFQTFQDDYAKSAQHMNSGLAILLRNRPLKLVRTESRYCVAKCKPRVFCRLLYRLYHQSVGLFDCPMKTLPRTTEDWSLPLIPSHFDSLEDARDCLFTEIDWIMHSQAQWQDISVRTQALYEHVDRLSRWDRSYVHLTRSMTPTSRQKKACALIRMARHVAYPILFATMFTNVDACLSSLTPDLEDGSEEHEDENDGLALANKALQMMIKNKQMVSYNMAEIKDMVETIIADESIWEPDVSDRAISYVSPEELVVPEVGVWGIAQSVNVNGESAVLKAIRNRLPENVDIECVGITCAVEDRRLILRYYVPDEFQLGFRWKQEHWEF